MIYKYCDKCGKPIEDDTTNDRYTFCLECALELYQKIFYNGPQNLKGTSN